MNKKIIFIIGILILGAILIGWQYSPKHPVPSPTPTEKDFITTCGNNFCLMEMVQHFGNFVQTMISQKVR